MSIHARGSRGLQITRLEISLREIGLYHGPIDDVFGAGLEAAVRAYQQRAGLPVTGDADEETQARILGEPSPRAAAVAGKPAEYRSLALTAGFETSIGPPDCFAGLAGDFDGQGISFGVLQWNLGQGTLQPLLQGLDAHHPEVVQAAFESGHGELLDVLVRDRPAQLAWARGIQAANRRTLSEPWRSRFKALGRTAECQAAQVRAAEQLFERARRMCDEYGLWSQRGAALMFDIVVQNGSIRAATRLTITDEFERIPTGISREEEEVTRMRIIANRRAEAARREFVEDVRRRKLTIANGAGIVHGVGYDLQRQYLLDLVARDGGAVEMSVPAPA